MTTIFAAMHHMAVFTVMGCVLMSLVRLHQPFNLTTARHLRLIDQVNGAAATLVLVVGLVRVFYLEKGAEYYFHNAPFVTKLVLYTVASALSLVPTLALARWRVPLRHGQVPAVSLHQLARLRVVAYLQLVCVFAMAACAAMAARGA